MDIFGSVAEWFLSLLPEWDDNGVVVTASNWVASLIQGASALGVWFPWQVLGVCFGLVTTWYLGSIGVRVLRWLVGFIPTMGSGT